jgi:PhnB protein
MLMMGQAKGEWKATTTSIYMYVEDVDKIYRRAVDAGGVSVQEPQDMFYGDRHGGVKDPSGNTWWIATHKEDVSPEEIERRMHAYAGQH